MLRSLKSSRALAGSRDAKEEFAENNSTTYCRSFVVSREVLLGYMRRNICNEVRSCNIPQKKQAGSAARTAVSAQLASIKPSAAPLPRSVFSSRSWASGNHQALVFVVAICVSPPLMTSAWSGSETTPSSPRCVCRVDDDDVDDLLDSCGSLYVFDTTQLLFRAFFMISRCCGNQASTTA